MLFISLIQKIHSILWNAPLICLIIGVGIILTIKLKALQICKLPLAFKFLFKDDHQSKGHTSPFQALCIALSATIGTGNITGVSAAIMIGGPGALFWMVITAFLGMAIKYAEGFLAIKYRKITSDQIIGGPYAYIEYGMGKKWRFLAHFFATFGMLTALFGMGTLIQMNSISDAFKNIFDKDQIYNLQIGKYHLSWVSLIISLLVTILVAIVLIGGVKRIGTVCEFLVPFMGISYVVICLILIANNITNLQTALKEIFQMAISPRSVLGGTCGYTIMSAIKQGVTKGLFTNEAGLGSAPIATATTSSNDPVRQGLIAMTSTFLGTIIICTLTGIASVITKSYEQPLSGIYIAEYTFVTGLPFKPIITMILLLICIICFAFTTMIGWNLYGVQCLNYLTKGNQFIKKFYNWLYIIILFLGAFLEFHTIWDITEIFSALMAFPNLIAILALNKEIVKDTKEYFIKNTNSK